MLKWSIVARREASEKSDLSDFEPTPSKTKRRRRSSTNRRRSTPKRSSLDALEADKENQFTSTPIKSSENHHQFDVLRDVSNLKPTPHNRSLILSAKKCKSDKKRRHSSPKKKKKCINPTHNADLASDSQNSNFFRPFETVDSHIEGILEQKVCNCKQVERFYAPTLPNFTVDLSPCTILNTNCLVNDTEEDCPPTKKSKFEPINDFLHHILTPTNKNLFPGLKLNSTTKNNDNNIKVSPLVKKFLELRFSRIEDDVENSSYINELSLDEIVDALLDNTKQQNDNVKNEHENNVNETQQDNIVNSVQERKLTSSCSSDSGFRSLVDCKCNNNNNNNNNKKSNNLCDKTIINMNETFNERCVDGDDNLLLLQKSRKRTASLSDHHEAKRLHLEDSDPDCLAAGGFTLRRQKCIRRRRTTEKIKKTTTNIIDDSFTLDCTPLRSCYMENKEILNKESRSSTRTRRCITFESPIKVVDEFSGLSESTSTSRSVNIDVRGSLELNIYKENDELIVNVIRCKDLYRPNDKCLNAYVKVYVSEKSLENKTRKRIGSLQRTAVHSDSSRPVFNHFFKFPIGDSPQKQRIHVEVWHRERTTRSSEFLGCMSFDVGHVTKEGINGTFRLLSQSIGRTKNVAITLEQEQPEEDTIKPLTMCESQSSVDELISIDDLDNDLKKTTNKTVLSEQQKYADENLFLRYLELDPTEGPEAIPAATQRKATGNKNGRTPFTHTKKLVRPPKSGFGFSVVWTHPPRIERVEKGLPADKAGILPGDYIIFVDKHNVVMMPEIDILNLIRSYGSQLTLEIFRRNPSRNGSVPSVKRLVSTPATTTTTGSTTTGVSSLSVSAVQSLPQRRPSTVCSTNTTSADYSRRKLNLPQVTFSAEKQTNNPEENRKNAMYQLISKEQQYATGMQFAITRFVSSLAERRDLLTSHEHRILFQNSEELLRITEDILDHLIQDDGDAQIHLLSRTYHIKLNEIITAYRRYCAGIKKADFILANKLKNSNSEFVRFIQIPTIPRRRPDLTTFIHKPLEHYREVLKLLINIQSQTKPNHEDYAVINQIVHDLQLAYREITSEAGLMEPMGEGRPLLTVQDLENRLVFTKCKPFVLNKPGRQWIFGGDLSRIEGRNVRQYWTLLFSDLLLFAKVSRDRVLFITEDPLPLTHIVDVFFNVRKKDTEFRITVSPEGRKATSPTVHCGPDLSRTPRKNANKRTVILRAPTTELKAVWQNLLQRQIFQVNAGMEGSSFSSPLESPDAPITSSVATLQSAESFTFRRQTPQNINQNQNETKEIQKQIDALIELKCKQLSKTNFNSKYNAIHLEKWMKGQLEGDHVDLPEMEPLSEQDWTEEMLRKRSEELQLIDCQGNITYPIETKGSESHVEDLVLSDHDISPSKSTTTESQVTVRSSPLVPETVPVCKQCHKNCITSNGNVHTFVESLTNGTNYKRNDRQQSLEEDDWQPLLLLGLCANPAASLVKLDPFIPQVPKISVEAATPESSTKTAYSSFKSKDDCQCQNLKKETNNMQFSNDVSPDDSPQTEEHPYHSLSSSVQTLRRFGTVSSLERVGSEEHDDLSSTGSEAGSDDKEKRGIDNEAFNHSSIRSWTARAGNFMAEKIAFLEEYRPGGGFFEKYLKSPESVLNGEQQELQEDETSGATSGEEIWGTPTSGGELDDPLYLNYEGKQSPNDGSISSENGDDTELMMDELLMTPPITGAVMRGLLPRRTLEPLIEEECSETSTSSTTSLTEPSISPEQGNEIGDVADTCLPAVERHTVIEDNAKELENMRTRAAATATPTASPSADTITVAAVTKIHRSESYRHIIEAAENEENENDICFFNRFKPTAKFVNIERVPRNKSIKIFEFFNVRRAERRIYETFPEGSQYLRTISKETGNGSDENSPSHSDKSLSPRRLKDKQLDRRFWKQLSKRRAQKINTSA